MATGGASFFIDLKAYVEGGHTIFQWIGSQIGMGPSDGGVTVSTPSGDPSSAAQGPSSQGNLDRAGPSPAEVQGVRSISYAVFAYLSGIFGGGFIVLALVQAGAAWWLLTAVFERLVLTDRMVLVAIALCPALALGVTHASPDIWTGLLALALFVAAEPAEREAPYRRLIAIVIAGAAISFHASNLPVAVVGTAAYASILLLQRTPVRSIWRGTAPLGVAIALGAAVPIVGGLVGFGEVSVAPKRYPLTLARAIEDGPAYAHLQEHCDTYDYVVCELFPDGPPRNIGEFLWSETGIVARATPEQMDRLREEEVLILRRTFAQTPREMVGEAFGNGLEQLGKYDLQPSQLNRRAEYRGEGRTNAVRVDLGSPFRNLGYLAGILHTALVPLAALAGAAAFILGWPGAAKVRFLGLCCAVIVANAFVCGIFSTPVDRYQARVVWLIVVAALPFIPEFLQLIVSRNKRSFSSTQHEVQSEDQSREVIEL
jgi:hypothetical protein